MEKKEKEREGKREKRKEEKTLRGTLRFMMVRTRQAGVPISPGLSGSFTPCHQAVFLAITPGIHLIILQFSKEMCPTWRGQILLQRRSHLQMSDLIHKSSLKTKVKDKC